MKTSDIEKYNDNKQMYAFFIYTIYIFFLYYNYKSYSAQQNNKEIYGMSY